MPKKCPGPSWPLSVCPQFVLLPLGFTEGAKNCRTLDEYFGQWSLLARVAGILGLPSELYTIVLPEWLKHVVWTNSVDYNIKPVIPVKLKYLF